MSTKEPKPELLGVTFTKRAKGFAITAKMRSADNGTNVSFTVLGLSLHPSSIKAVRDLALAGALDAMLALTDED